MRRLIAERLAQRKEAARLAAVAGWGPAEVGAVVREARRQARLLHRPASELLGSAVDLIVAGGVPRIAAGRRR